MSVVWVYTHSTPWRFRFISKLSFSDDKLTEKKRKKKNSIRRYGHHTNAKTVVPFLWHDVNVLLCRRNQECPTIALGRSPSWACRLPDLP